MTYPFLKELRKQFLVWRTLDEETTDRYRASGGDPEAAERHAAREAKRSGCPRSRIEAEKKAKKQMQDELAARGGDAEAQTRLDALQGENPNELADEGTR